MPFYHSFHQAFFTLVNLARATFSGSSHQTSQAPLASSTEARHNFNPVRVLASLLILMIALHTACMAQCLAETSQPFQKSAVPPCHHEDGTKQSHSPVPLTCSEGPALEAKLSSLQQCASCTAAVPVVSAASFVIQAAVGHDVSDGMAAAQVPLPAHYISALRI
jgi:hypothetical protein